MSTIKRTSRESEKKASKEAKKTWTPPSSLDAPPAPNGYAHRWIRTNVQGFEDTANVSKKLREEANYICDNCKSDCKNNKHLLHVHHKDGVKWNNNLDNLEVLCAACHFKKPGHKNSYKKVI